MLCWARSLPIPSRDRDGREVMGPLGAMRIRREEGVVADPDLSVQSDLLGLARPWLLGLSLAGVF
jgi:hypothetical protein